MVRQRPLDEEPTGVAIHIVRPTGEELIAWRQVKPFRMSVSTGRNPIYLKQHQQDRQLTRSLTSTWELGCSPEIIFLSSFPQSFRKFIFEVAIMHGACNT